MKAYNKLKSDEEGLWRVGDIQTDPQGSHDENNNSWFQKDKNSNKHGVCFYLYSDVLRIYSYKHDV